jgi:hypothetical protein
MTNPAKTLFKINSTWIARGEIKAHTEAYLNHLFSTDLERFERTVNHTMAVLAAHGTDPERALTDPKPYFYAAVFFYATKEERVEFLADHLFTRAVLAAARCELESTPLYSKALTAITEAKVAEIAAVLLSA